MEEGLLKGREPIQEDGWIRPRLSEGGYRLIYFGEPQPRRWSAGVPRDRRYRAKGLDRGEMTIRG